MFILCNLKGQCLNHDHVAHDISIWELSVQNFDTRQPMSMRTIFALSRAQLLLLVVTRSRELSRECHVTKHKTQARSNFPLSNFENSGSIQFSSSRSTSRGLCPKNIAKGIPYFNIFLIFCRKLLIKISYINAEVVLFLF